MTSPSARLRRPLATAALLALLAGTAACGAGSGDAARTADQNDAAGGMAAPEGAADTASRTGLDDAEPAAERALISAGDVQLRSGDVGAALFDVQQVVDALGGEVAQSDTSTDDDGRVRRARMVLRIPSGRFAEAIEDLEGVATLTSSSTNVQDVTTRVIDTDIRVRVQRRSIRRIEILLDQATSIRDIVGIEEQLSRRQADLGSLERQQSHLADQTSMATITVSIERTSPKRKTEDDAGFLAGLESGWTGLANVAVGLATAFGAALPFVVVLLLVGVPARLLLRRRHLAAAQAPQSG